MTDEESFKISSLKFQTSALKKEIENYENPNWEVDLIWQVTQLVKIKNHLKKYLHLQEEVYEINERRFNS